MMHDGIAVPTTSEIHDREQLATVLKAVIETAENIVSHERQQRDDHDLSKQADLSPLFTLNGDVALSLKEVEKALSSLSIEEHWQHDHYEPGSPCPLCGDENISVIEPREYFYTYDNEGTVVDSTLGNVSGPAMNHYCRDCDTLLSCHPATALFWIE
jgi:hypothetical protein